MFGLPDSYPEAGGRKQPFRVIGPTGAKELMANLEKAYAADVRIRIADQKLHAAGAKIVTEEFSSDGVVYEQDGARDYWIQTGAVGRFCCAVNTRLSHLAAASCDGVQ